MPPPYAEGHRRTRDNIFFPAIAISEDRFEAYSILCRPETAARMGDHPFLSLIDMDFVDKKLTPPIYSLPGLCGHRNVR